jgi:hypothetical protein
VIRDLDALPTPEYDDYFEALRASTRPCAQQRNWTASEVEAEVYRACDVAQTPGAVLTHVSARRGAEVAQEEIESSIETLCHNKVLLRLNGKLLGLGVRG